AAWPRREDRCIVTGAFGERDTKLLFGVLAKERYDKLGEEIENGQHDDNDRAPLDGVVAYGRSALLLPIALIHRRLPPFRGHLSTSMTRRARDMRGTEVNCKGGAALVQ